MTRKEAEDFWHFSERFNFQLKKQKITIQYFHVLIDWNYFQKTKWNIIYKTLKG